MSRFRLLTALGATLVLATGTAHAATTVTLSSAEYQQLTQIQSYASSSKSIKTLSGVHAALASCRRLDPVSGLVRTERNDCAAAFDWVATNLHILARLKVCDRRTSVDGRFACLFPGYRDLSIAVRGLYRAEAAVARAATNRGFSNACVEALGNSPQAITDEQRMSQDAARLVSAIRARNVLQVQKYGGLYDADLAESESAASKQHLSVCPHLSN